MRLPDQIAIVLDECGALLRACPLDDERQLARTFRTAGLRLDTVGEWLLGQAALIEGPPCGVCGGRGWLTDEVRCPECEGAGHKPLPQRRDSEPPKTQQDGPW